MQAKLTTDQLPIHMTAPNLNRAEIAAVKREAEGLLGGIARA